MTDNILTKHAQLNAGVMPASAEELAQKHQTLFQEYSRLKAQHTVLKRAVKKERTENASLQGDAKEKEKELRKLQGQLDLLAFHNERLSKRIEAVQELDTKGSHFSLLGGAIKKELEKSTQALEAANLDLAKKIEENEELRSELSDIHHIYTDNLNRLCAQIDNLQKRIEELQDERALLQSETSSQSSSLVKERANLESEIVRLQEELSTKTKLLDEYQQQDNQEDKNLEYEQTITDLRTQLADLSSSTNDQIEKLEIRIKDLQDTITQLKSSQADKESAAEQRIKQLEHDIEAAESTANQLRTQHTDQSTSTEQQIQKLENEIKDLQQANSLLKQANTDLEFQKNALVKDNATLRIDTSATVEKLTGEVQQKEQVLNTMEEKIAHLETQLEEQQQQLSDLRVQVVSYEKSLEEQQQLKEKANDRINQRQSDIHNNIVEEDEEEEEEEEDDDQPFVYPVPKDIGAAEKDGTQSNNNDERSVDPTSNISDESKQQASQIGISSNEDNNGDRDDNNDNNYDESKVAAMIQEREDKMKQYYESKLNQLTEKLQTADSKACRFANLVESLKDKLTKQDEEKRSLHNEIQRLKDEVIKGKESLSTTESKYQEQLDMLTEYTTSLQMEVAKAQSTPV
ncbi:uncharacterized protein BX664DRAFT_318797 [Halteromyces radiatus]|uniref:uncharacterized protein n=1 Tax=Halteromyces radiatus TaxID=101107 RepID=UPI00221FECBE|nr:uncharacterized protein BX664DRAFT_318797 [Halteromyces radiatus]KAI8098479.1 hypothetical protein BX664DRAFT_318797 [Halteromyces radiatus]